MIRPKFVTFTGVDDCTDLKRVQSLSYKYPIEWGVLFGGRIGANRYPSEYTIEEIETVAEYDVRFAAHLCGKYSRAVMNYSVPNLSHAFRRVQVNAAKYDDMEPLEYLADELKRDVVVQHRYGDFLTRFVYPRIHFVHDQSGGRGKTPSWHPSQKTDKLVGYAGGLGPHNVKEVLSNLDAKDELFWLDMETHIRDEDDWLDLDKCEAVCKEIWG